MKNKKFMLGLATSTVVIPLVGMMAGCTQNTTSKVASLTKTNNKTEGEYNLTIYLEGDIKFDVVEKVIPTPFPHVLNIELPKLIIDHGKKLDLDRIEQEQGWWNYTGDSERHPLGHSDDKTITIINAMGELADNIDVHIPLKNIDEDYNIENCSWTDFLYWYNMCEFDGKHNFKNFKSMFGLPVDEDSLVGIERTVKWDELDHKVRIVDTDEEFDNHSKLYYAPEDGKDVLDSNENPTEYGRVGLTFQFVNVLTKKTKDGNQIWKTQWHRREILDDNYNCWATTSVHSQSEPTDYWISESSKIRNHLNNQKTFLDKFEDQDFLNAIKPTYIRRFGLEAHKGEEQRRNWIKEKFFIASGHQMGLPKRGDQDAPDWEYYIEPDEECQTFAYWTNHKDKDYRKFYRVGRHEGDKSEQIWIASPCNAGGGTFHTEHVFEIDFDGSWNHVAMDHERDILPCFSL